MAADFEQAVKVVLKHEGGWVNDPTDPGGATNWGISLRYLKTVGDRDGDGHLDGDIDNDGDVDWQDIKLMTVDQAKAFYKAGWWDANRYFDFAQPVATKIFDTAVNTGSKRAHMLAQKACNHLGFKLRVDGELGPASRQAIRALDPIALLKELRQQQADFYEDLIAAKPKFKKYRMGWLRRALS
jgi:lysozyme family protein